jgi:hypothetical protein
VSDVYNEVFRAVRDEDPGLLRRVIATGGDVNAADPRPLVGHMNTPLHEAANRGNAALVQILLDAGAAVDARCLDGWTPLMRACNAGAFEVTKVLVDAGADITLTNNEGYTAYGRIPGDAADVLAFMRIHHGLRDMGIICRAATALQEAAARATGMLVVCGPAGAGKTTLAALLEAHAGLPMLGDLRMPDEIGAALRRAEHQAVVAVVRSGESTGLSTRWNDMGIPAELVEKASVTTATVRRLPRIAPAGAPSDVLAVEVLGPDRALRTRSLVEETRALVSAGLVTVEAARLSVVGYD